MEFKRNKGNRQKHSIKAFTRTDEAIACMTLKQPTLSQIGGTEPRRPTIRSGTVKAYGCDFHSSYMSSSSVTGLSSPPSSAPWYSQQVINREHYYAQRQTEKQKSHMVLSENSKRPTNFMDCSKRITSSMGAQRIQVISTKR
jgi:hypothetical protein